MNLRVEPSAHNQRLDRYLFQKLKSRVLSRQYLIKALKNSNLFINNAKAKPSTRLKPGDVIHGTIVLPPPPIPSLSPQEGPLDVLYEDDHLIVINKPPGLVVHPGHGNWSGTLVNILLHRYPELAHQPSTDRPGIVHRLDKFTSGALVIAKTHKALIQLSRMFAEHKVQKNYLALCVGIPPWRQITIDEPIGRHPTNRIKFTVTATGKPAITHLKVIQTFPEYGLSLIMAQPITGRTHQIRVHTAHSKLPVLGDHLYGGWTRIHQEQFSQLWDNYPVRYLLHAWVLSFNHPISNKPLSLRAPLPPDFKHILGKLKVSWELLQNFVK